MRVLKLVIARQDGVVLFTHEQPIELADHEDSEYGMQQDLQPLAAATALRISATLSPEARGGGRADGPLLKEEK